MLRLRPHHGMCIANFVGRGYDEAFTVNMNQTAEALKAEPQQEIWLKAGEDVLCSRCPHCQGQCVTLEKVQKLDQAVLTICGLEDGSTVIWQEFEQMVKEKILDSGRFDQICSVCRWYDFCSGIMACRR